MPAHGQSPPQGAKCRQTRTQRHQMPGHEHLLQDGLLCSKRVAISCRARHEPIPRGYRPRAAIAAAATGGPYKIQYKYNHWNQHCVIFLLDEHFEVTVVTTSINKHLFDRSASCQTPIWKIINGVCPYVSMYSKQVPCYKRNAGNYDNEHNYWHLFGCWQLCCRRWH